MVKPDIFDQIVADLLRHEKPYRDAVCADPEDTIGKSKWRKLNPAQQDVIKKIACNNLSTEDLEKELGSVGKSYSYYITDW